MGQSIELFGSMSIEARSAVQIAEAERRELGHAQLNVDHLVLGLCVVACAELEAVMRVARFRGLEFAERLRAALREAAAASGGTSSGADARAADPPSLRAAARAAARLNLVARRAFDLADACFESEIRPVHLLLAVLDDAQGVAATLLQGGRSAQALGEAIRVRLEQRARSTGRGGAAVRAADLSSTDGRPVREGAAPSAATADAAGVPSASEPEPGDTGTMPLPPRLQPYLRRYGQDLTAAAAAGQLPPVVGREAEILAVLRIFAQERKPNPLLVGEPGVGKTAIVEALAHLTASPAPPAVLRGRRIVSLSMASLLRGTSYRGQLEERLMGILHELQEDPSVILFLDELHTVVGAGRAADQGMDVADALKPALARGTLRCIAAITCQDYQRHLRRDKALERRFQVVEVSEPAPSQVLDILRGLRSRYEAHHGVTIPEATLRSTVVLAEAYLPNRRFPDKALDLLDSAAARARFPTLQAAGEAASEVEAVHVAQVVAHQTGLPVSRLVHHEHVTAAQLQALLQQRVVGQQAALETLAQSLHASRILGRGQRPQGVYLFLGPSGVGKTETARALAEVLFGAEHCLVRLDMAEYAGAESTARLVGSSPGLVGHEAGGQLTEAVRRHAHCVVLLDEVEKAHPEVLQLCQHLLDRGHLTDGRGEVADFRHAVVILTSTMQSLELGTLPHELLGRVDEILTFRTLQEEDLRCIARLQLSRLAEDLAALGVTLVVDSAACHQLASSVGSRPHGARELLRQIDRQVHRPVARLVAAHPEGVSVTVRAADGSVSVEAAAPPPPDLPWSGGPEQGSV